MRRVSGAHRLPPSEWWPAGVAGISADHVALSTGVAVRVVSAGPPSGPPVVCVHGWGVHSYLWRRNIESLVRAGRSVYALDLPGHGLSDRPLSPGSYTLERMTSHIAALFDALDIARAPIIAQSMGGRIATEFAIRFPARVDRLVLFGSVGFGAVPRAVALAPKLPIPRGPLSTALVQRWMIALGKFMAYGRRATIDPVDVDAYWAVTQFPDYLAAMRQALVEFDWRTLTETQIASIAAPTLVVFGTLDRTVRPRDVDLLVRALPHGVLRWIRDAGHVANEEAADEANAIIGSFLG